MSARSRQDWRADYRVELEQDEAEQLTRAGHIVPVCVGSENTYFTNAAGLEFFCKDYPNAEKWPHEYTAEGYQAEPQPPATRERPHCTYCGSTDIYSDACATWDVDAQAWSITTTYDNTDCSTCGGECSIEWRPAIELEHAALWDAMKAQPDKWHPTTRAMYDEMLEVLPPAAMGPAWQGSPFLVGEPYTHDSEGRAVYACFMESMNEVCLATYMTLEQFQDNHVTDPQQAQAERQAAHDLGN